MKRGLILAAVAATFTLALGQPKAQAQASMEIVASFYPKYLHRHADKSGVHYWHEQHRRGLPLREIEARILGGDEYYRVHGLSGPGFVQGMLLEVNGVAPPERVAYYLSRLQATGSRLVVAREVLGLVAPPVVIVQPQPQPVQVQPPFVSQSPPVVEAQYPQPQPSPVYVPAAPVGGPTFVTGPPTTVIVPEPVYVPAYAPGPVYYPRYAPYRSSVNLNLVLPFGRR